MGPMECFRLQKFLTCAGFHGWHMEIPGRRGFFFEWHVLWRIQQLCIDHEVPLIQLRTSKGLTCYHEVPLSNLTVCIISSLFDSKYLSTCMESMGLNWGTSSMGLICILHMSKLTNKEGTRQQQTLCSGQWYALHTSYVQNVFKACSNTSRRARKAVFRPLEC